MLKERTPAGLVKFEASRARAASYKSKSYGKGKTPAKGKRGFKGQQASTSGRVQSASSAEQEPSTSSAGLPAPETPEARIQASAKGFVLFPIMSVGTKHIRYNTEAARQFCERVFRLKPKELEEKLKGETPADHAAELWNMCFKLPSNLAKAFAGSMSTNGVDISWSCGRLPRDDQMDGNAAMKKRKTNAGRAINEQPQDRFVGVSKRPIEDYDRTVGFDPGLKAAFGGVIVTNDERGKDAEQRVCYRSTEFRYLTGEYERAKRRKRVTGKVDKLNADLLQKKFPDLNTKNPVDYKKITEYRLRHFQLCQSTYDKRCITRLSWQKTMRVRKAVDDLVNYWATGKVKCKKKIAAKGEKKKKKEPKKRRRKREKIRLAKMQEGKKQEQKGKKTETEKRTDKHRKDDCGTSEMDMEMQDLYASVGSMSMDEDDGDVEMIEPEAMNKPKKNLATSRSTTLAEITLSTKPKMSTKDDDSDSDDGWFDLKTSRSRSTSRTKHTTSTKPKTSTKADVVKIEPKAPKKPKKNVKTSRSRSTSRAEAKPSTSKKIEPDIAKPRRTLIMMGSIGIPGYMHGHVRGPLRLFEKRLRDRALRHQKDIYVDEFRTTMLCSECNGRCVTSRSPHRYQFCHNCGITWNRDVNAGRNIRHLGLYRQKLVGEKYMPKPNNFSRHERLLSC